MASASTPVSSTRSASDPASLPTRSMLIRGGRVVTASGERDADVLVRDGRIAEVRPGLAASEDVIDATGLLVLPGVVDPHTHLLLDTGTTRTADDFESGSLSAAAGGVTTFLDFAPQ